MIPVWFSNVTPSTFGEDQIVGGVVVDVKADRKQEAKRIAGLVANKLKDRMLSG